MSKQAIMEVLLSGDNTLTKDQISWAIANIPNETTKEGLAFDHSADDMFAACGVSMNNGELAEEYANLRINTPGDKKSQFIEHLEANGSPALIRSLVIRGVYSVAQKAEEKQTEISSDLAALLAMIKKLK